MDDAELVKRAARRRAALAHNPLTTAYRLVHGAADGLPGVAVDRYGAALVLNFYDDAAQRRERALVAALAALPGVDAIYVKRRPRNPARLSAAEVAALAPPRPAWGRAMVELIVSEGGLRFLVRPGAGLSMGLYLDMRETRARVRTLAHDRTVLNLFAYTCAFGVAASAGGAGRVLNLDAARPALEWGMQNYRLNNLAADAYDFVYGDAFDWLARLARRETLFDVVIADPPSFATVKGRRFAVSHDYAELAAAGARVVAPGGTLVLCANEGKLPRHAFRAACLRGIGAMGRSARVHSYTGAPELDFPTLPGAESHLKVLELVVDG